MPSCKLTLVAALIASTPVSCIENFENRGSPQPLPPSTATKTMPASASARSTEPLTCEEAEARVARALERRDEAALSSATSSRERLCWDPALGTR